MNIGGEMSKRRIIVVNLPDDISPELAARRLAEARAEAGRDGVVIRVIREDGQAAVEDLADAQAEDRPGYITTATAGELQEKVARLGYSLKGYIGVSPNDWPGPVGAAGPGPQGEAVIESHQLPKGVKVPRRFRRTVKAKKWWIAGFRDGSENLDKKAKEDLQQDEDALRAYGEGYEVGYLRRKVANIRRRSDDGPFPLG